MKRFILLATLICGCDSVDPATYAGTYNLVSVDRQRLPAEYTFYDPINRRDYHPTVYEGSLELDGTGGFTMTKITSMEDETRTFRGRYEISGSEIMLVSGFYRFDGEIEGDLIAVPFTSIYYDYRLQFER